MTKAKKSQAEQDDANKLLADRLRRFDDRCDNLTLEDKQELVAMRLLVLDEVIHRMELKCDNLETALVALSQSHANQAIQAHVILTLLFEKKLITKEEYEAEHEKTFSKYANVLAGQGVPVETKTDTTPEKKETKKKADDGCNGLYQ